MKMFVLPGVVTRKRHSKPIPVALFLKADDLQDARWQAHHGVIEMNVSQKFSGATVKYDLRRIKLHRE